MEHSDILATLKTAIIDGDAAMAADYADKALAAGVDPLMAVEQGLSQGMTYVGDRFESGDAFLPELLMAAETFTAAMNILQPALEQMKKDRPPRGKVVIGSVKGDVHNIGKDIVATVLGINGYQVKDLGVDVPSLTFIEEAERFNADVIGLSAIMTTTMPYQQEVIETLIAKNLRDRYVVIIGGGSVTQQWTDRIGADACGRSAVDTLEKLGRLIKRK